MLFLEIMLLCIGFLLMVFGLPFRDSAHPLAAFAQWVDLSVLRLFCST